MTVKFKIACYSFLALISGCSNMPQHYAFPALELKRPLSILVIPPLNDSVEVNASYTFLSTISRPLAEKGYYVFPVALIDAFLKENGLPTPAEMNDIPLQKIKEHIGADAVLYVKIHDWGQKFKVVDSTAVVRVEMRLVDVDSAQVLWTGSAEAQEHENTDNNLSFSGKLLSAVVEQMVGSVIDNTPDLSRIAINNAFYNGNYGLLDGPYLDFEKEPH